MFHFCHRLMKKKILSTVRELQSEREEAQIVPSHVRISEIINHGCHDPYAAINELVNEGKLNWCRTLNEVAFTIKDFKL